MYGVQEELTEKNILKYVSQKEIYEHFLQIEVQLKEFFCSPLRRDEYPTCNFSWYQGKLMYRDWAEPKPITCFQAVQKIRNCTYIEALQLIRKELINDDPDIEVREPEEREEIKQKGKTEKSNIRVEFHKWQPEVVNYLKQYGITREICKKFNVFPIKRVWVNKNLTWTYNSSDPALGYFFGKTEDGEQRWKIYFFKRNNFRFLCNTNRINGWVQIPDSGKNLIITKSLKDVMSLYRLGYHSIAMQNETTEPYDYIIHELQDRFDQLWSFYDFDKPGVRLANTLNRKYNIPYLFLTNGNYQTYDYGSKDISDYIADNNLQQAKSFLQKCIPPF